MPINSTVWLSCYYEGEYSMIIFKPYKLSTLSLLDEHIRIGYVTYNSIKMKCIFDISTGHANWTWKDPSTHEKRFDLPQCWSKCSENPMLISNTVNNWTQLVIYFSFESF